MSELVLRLAVERLQSLVLADQETAPLNRSASGHLYAILGELKRMQVWLKGKTQHKDRVRKIEELDYQIEDVIETYRVLGRSRRSLSNIEIFNGIKMICMRYVWIPFALRKIKSDIVSIIKEIEEAVPVADSIENQGPTRSSRASYSSLFGLKEDQKRVRQVLLSRTGSNIPESSSQIGVPVIPICGAVGSGKTTLAKRILYEDSIVTKEFNTRIWVNVSEKFEIRDILRQILVSCHGWMKHMFYSSEEQLLERIEERLKSQRTLIVLDDIRSIEAWETLCKTFPKLDKGSIVLVTTRVGYVAEYICRNEYVHTMTPLNEEALFRAYTGQLFFLVQTCFKLSDIWYDHTSLVFDSVV